MSEFSAETEEGFELLHKFAAAVFALLKESLAVSPFVPSRSEFAAFGKPGEWARQEVIDYDYMTYFKTHLCGDTLWRLPEAVAFARWFHSHPAAPGARITDAYKRDFDAVVSAVVGDLLYFLNDYLRRRGPLCPIDEELLRSCWREIGDLFQQKNARCVFLIEGLDVESPLDLGPFGTLVPLTPEEKTAEFQHCWWDVKPWSVADVAECQAQLLPASHRIEYFSDHAAVVMTALRLTVSPNLYGYGPIGLALTDRVPCALGVMWTQEFAVPSAERGRLFRGRSMPTALLGDKDRPRIRLMGGDLERGALERFAMAFRRFNLALRRQSIEDRIVDLAIVLESTVLAGFKDELFWRAQVLGTELLRDQMDARTARDQIRALYSARSCIVHGEVAFATEYSSDSKTSKEWRRVGQTVDDFDAAMVELVRRILVATVERADVVSSAPEFSKSLEEAVLFHKAFSVRAVTSSPASVESAPVDRTAGAKPDTPPR